MSIRDEELKRIRLYARGLGVKLTIKNYNWDDFGEWSNKPTHEININKRIHGSKTELIFTILHELGHVMYYAHNGNVDIPEAVLLESKRNKKDKPIPKKERKKIYEYEKNGISYMEIIAKELDLKIPMWKVLVAQEFDIWVYEYYYENGDYPPTSLSKEMKKKIQNKHKGNK